MNRRLPLVLLLLLVGAPPLAAAEPSPLGEWITEDGKARVRIQPCAGRGDELCGVIAWSFRPADAPKEGPLLDHRNADPALRRRPILGLPLMQGFRPAGAGRWDHGTIYDPEGGRTYRSTMRLSSADRLEVSGCVLFICRRQTWRRAAGG
jgi:uncharacterized protein (DUF2147 family)